ncbi:DM13 domain-containing protein [Plantactinospora sp. B5E13]|uniref:DM13 domain-containing protein n=1 Tax=Plantactinospora sp. B5E13 TaxID=3153758 RepID=UPI00325EA5E3
MSRRLLRAPLTWVAVAVLGAVAVVGGYWFQPWKIVVDRTVAEPLSEPVPATAPEPSGSPGTTGPVPAGSPSGTVTSGPPGPGPTRPVLVGSGEFVTHEHRTTGTARIVRAPDGRHRLELVGLDTSDGPDLRVWLTDQPVREGTAGWRVFDDGRWVELGRLKGNRGDQAYPIPTGTDLHEFRSVSIWCKRFSVSFGAAELHTVG